jgi:hypothetical protein
MHLLMPGGSTNLYIKHCLPKLNNFISILRSQLPARLFAGVVDTGVAKGALTCEYLRQFLQKIRNDPNVIFRGFLTTGTCY